MRYIFPSALHKTPDDLVSLFSSNKKLIEKWNDITPLARNEWICWIESAKREGTRKERI